jgi:hypothetical protein
MRIGRLALARAVGVLAICVAPAFAVFGWWVLAVAAFLGLLASALAPAHGPRGHRTIVQRTVSAARRRFGAHRWRPGHR